MSLTRTAMNHAKTIDYFYVMVFLMVINNVVLNMISSEMMYRVSKGSVSLVLFVIILGFVIPLIDVIFITPLITSITSQTRVKFRTIAIQKYNSVSFEGKNKSPAKIFWQKLNNATPAIERIIDWGLITIINLIGSFIGCLWTFIRMGLIVELILVLVFGALCYYFVIRKKQANYTKLRKQVRTTNEKLRSKIRLFLSAFQYKEVTPQYISKMDNACSTNNQATYKKWQEIMMLIRLMNKTGILVIGFITMTNIAKFMLVSMVLGDFSGAVSGLSRFVNQFNQYTNSFDTYTKFWNKLEIKPEPTKLNVPSNLQVEDVNIQRPNFSVTFSTLGYGTENTLPLGPRTTTLIQGPSGHGKSTFVEGLTGKLGGVIMNCGKPENYYHTCSDMYQNIREQLPSTGVSIRDWFKDEPNDAIIMRCLQLCFWPQELEKLLTAIELANKDNDDLFTRSTYIDFHQTGSPGEQSPMGRDTGLRPLLQASRNSPLDLDIQEIPSGGQKSRLCLATKCYEMLNKEMLILDEPEQGSDPKTRIWVINNILREFQHKTIVMVTHMCMCQLVHVMVNWTTQLYVENGIVSKIAKNDKRYITSSQEVTSTFNDDISSAII